MTVTGDQVSRQVHKTEMRKKNKKEASGFARSEEEPETEAWGEQEDAEADPDNAREEPSRAPDATWRRSQT